MATSATGDWLAALGTPSRPGTGIRPDESTVVQWLADVRSRGLAALRDCEGLYSFVHYDAASRCLEAMTDRAGMTPVYWATDEHGLWMSTSATAIACLRPSRISRDLIACLMLVGYPLRDLSVWEDIRRVGLAESVRYDGERVTSASWWTPPPVVVAAGRSAVRDWAEQYLAERVATLRSRLSAPWDVLASLTAGLDSRCACALLLAAVTDRPVRFFTGAMADGDEARVAGQVARRLGLQWEFVEGKLDAEGWRSLITQTAYCGDAENQPLSDASRWAREVGGARQVILWGLGGEMFRDYWSAHERVAWLLKGKDRFERLLNYRCAGSGIPLDLLAPEFAADARARVLAMLAQADRELACDSPLDRLEQLYATQRMRRWASHHLNSTGLWCVPDLPLMGQSALDLACRLPRSVRCGGELARWVLWMVCPAATQLPINEGYSARPRAHAGLLSRLGDLRLDLLKLSSKLCGRRTRGAPRNGAVPTFRAVFGDWLDVAGMRSSVLFREDRLRPFVEPRLDQPLAPSGMMWLVGLEAVLRYVRQAQASRA